MGSGSGQSSDDLKQGFEGAGPGQDDEDFTLAPLEEEAKQSHSNKDSKKESMNSPSSISKLPQDGPVKSLIEEQLEAGRLGAGESERDIMRQRTEQFKPLYPSGRVASHSGISPWLFFGGVFVFFVLALVIWGIASN